MIDPASRGPAARPIRAARPSSALVAAVLAAVVGALWWFGPTELSADRTVSWAPSGPDAGSADEPRDARAAATVADLDAAWDERARAQFLDAAGATVQSRTWAAEVYRNLRLLHAAQAHWRYVAGHTPGALAEPDESKRFTGDVEVRWTPGRRGGSAPRTTSAVTVPMRFIDDGERVSIIGTAPGSGDPLPVWLAGPLHVLTVPGGVCVGLGHSDVPALRALVRRAVRQVRDVVAAKRPVVMVVPSDARQAGWVLGSSVADIAQIAAVSTTVDGSSAMRAPVQVVLNPSVFDALDPVGAQVVLTHEATHAMTGATASPMPLWVAEGFADFVALHDGRVGLDLVAAEILERVRRHGPPTHLPTSADFTASAPGLGTTYESAWLAFRLLADRYSDAATVSFYQQVRDGASLRHALQAEFGLDLHELTDAWRSYLDRLATA